MSTYLRPGVFIEEIERGPRPIEGVPTSTAAFLGEAERGPITPRLVTSYNDYKRWFGDVFGTRERYMPYAASGFFENGGTQLYVCRIVGQAATSAVKTFGDFKVTAAGAGLWGNRVWVDISDGTTTALDSTGAKKSVGFRVRTAYWSSAPNNSPPFDPFADGGDAKVPRPSLIEDFDDLVTDPKSPDFYAKRLTGNSALISLDGPTGDDTISPARDKGGLDGGADGSGETGKSDFQGDPADQRVLPQGLSALELDPYRDVALVYAPYHAPSPHLVAEAVVTHCEKMKFRFAVVDPDKNVTNVTKLDPRTNFGDEGYIDSEYAAFYHPWLQISDPQNGVLRWVPPGGHVLGIYARTDNDRGVFKAPANEEVKGAVDLGVDINDGVQEQLNPRGVNCIRRFPGRGIRVWGARTLSSDGLWKYISVRRLFIFLERSIYENTQWVVFEPNDDRLWARVKDTIRLFLRSQWRGGALFGRTEDEAFFINIDRTTMSQDDILNGRLICEIGIAPVRPAEFVIFRIFQNTAEAQR